MITFEKNVEAMGIEEDIFYDKMLLLVKKASRLANKIDSAGFDIEFTQGVEHHYREEAGPKLFLSFTMERRKK